MKMKDFDKIIFHRYPLKIVLINDQKVRVIKVIVEGNWFLTLACPANASVNIMTCKISNYVPQIVDI